MDENGHGAPRASWARLWAAVVSEDERHPVGPGTLGEYSALLRRRDAEFAARAFPDVAAHLSNGCPECSVGVEELLALIAADEGDGEPPLLEATRSALERARVPGPGGTSAEIVVAVEYLIPHFPELRIRVLREYNGSLAQLVVIENVVQPPGYLDGWEIEVTPTKMGTTVRAVTGRDGMARLAWLPLDAVAEARVAIRPSPQAVG